MNSADVRRARPTVVIPCFNRREITLGCLERLKQIGVFASFHVLVVDDASTDGTAETIARKFPEVEVLRGHGELYWTGAVELGMRHAYIAGAGCFIWINDDTEVTVGAIEAITTRAEETGGIVSGQGIVIVEDKNYEGYFSLLYRGKAGLITVEADRTRSEIDVDTCRGNLVAISRKVVEGIGYPDGKHIPHFGGDSDYGLRASRAGFSVKVLPHALVRETGIKRTDNQSWLLGETPVPELWRRLFQKRNAFYPPMLFRYSCRHWGWIGFFKATFKILRLLGVSALKLMIPRRMRIFLFGGLSYSWKTLAPLRKNPSDSSPKQAGRHD